jgi:predicted enzyme related to lactoylglutathione lyase
MADDDTSVTGDVVTGDETAGDDTAGAGARLAMVCLDCAVPGELAEFWSAVLGWDVADTGEDYAMVSGPAFALAFDRVDDYVAPGWPNEHGSKQFHFDLAVGDIEATAARSVALGATRPDHQPAAGRWVVMLDPAGHPFCLTDAKNW